MRPILPLQYLRALAAVAVVFTHFQTETVKILGFDGAGFSMVVGAAGVDLFFVISGFVMVFASEPLFGSARGPAVFFLHRVVRIVPLYWAATTLYLLLAIAVPAFGKSYSPGFTAASYLFFPAEKPGAGMEPIVGQGWTLNYEMFFYLVFAFAVVWTRSLAVLVVSSVLVTFVAVASLLPQLPAALAFWSNSIILEFVLGMLLALAHRRGVRFSPRLGLVVVVTGLALLPLTSAYLADDPALRFVRWGFPAALVVAGATLGTFNPTGTLWRWIGTVGDASYALYLFHALPIRAVLYGARWTSIDVAALFWPLLLVTVLMAVAMAVVIHVLFERPTTQKLREYLGRHASARAAGQVKASA